MQCSLCDQEIAEITPDYELILASALASVAKHLGDSVVLIAHKPCYAGVLVGSIVDLGPEAIRAAKDILDKA